MLERKFYRHYAADPYFNMAFDEWLLRRVLAGSEICLLRLYTWQPAAITFGLNQRLESAFDHSKLQGTPIIRRITGGRALYHDRSELTYSIALNVKALNPNGQPPSMAAVSSAIARALVQFLQVLGIDSDYMRSSSPGNSQPQFFHKAPCFASHAKYEIMAQTGKIVASAQRRHEDVLFQHGSIKLQGVSPHPALTFAERGKTAFEPASPMAESVFDKNAQLFVQIFQDFFETPFRQTVPSEGEVQEIQDSTQWVKKNAIEKRDIFKQKHVTSSL